VKPTVKEITLFGMFGALMFASKKLMEVLPNIHLIGVIIVALTVVYRKKALYPIYLYVFLDGLFFGFSVFWVPYLYVWTVLWLMTMLLPKKMPKRLRPFVYMTVCALHGFMFGLLYAPFQALAFGLNFKGTVAWLVAGIPFDVTHGISNFICGLLICPIISALNRVDKKREIS
jgi:energy-coupling factor transport system substrate-specific component